MQLKYFINFKFIIKVNDSTHQQLLFKCIFNVNIIKVVCKYNIIVSYACYYRNFILNATLSSSSCPKRPLLYLRTYALSVHDQPVSG